MYVTQLRLENVKLFKDISFSFSRPDGTLAGWTVFVGGNSSGKSTLLRALALTLMGPDVGNRLLGTASGWISKGENRALAASTIQADNAYDKFKKVGRLPSGDFEAGVRWHFMSKDDEVPGFSVLEKRNPHGTRIQTAARGPWSPNSSGWFSAGYGPMRRLTGSSSESIRFSVSTEGEGRFVTLFREDAALSESEEWLRRMYARSLEPHQDHKDDIDKIIRGVRSLLEDGLLPEGMRISQITVDHVYLNDGRDVELPMRDISDGCRSVYATVLDIVHGLYEEFGIEGLFTETEDGRTIVNLPGVVIIDELEAHLHPAWQRDLPEWLKMHFPSIQFFVSTHSPLIAQAADPNGLFILPSQNDYESEPRPASDVEYEKIRLGSAYKTVLGVAFGLSTTRTRWAAERIRRWQELNAMRLAGAELTPEQATECEELRGQMEIAFDVNPSGIGE